VLVVAELRVAGWSALPLRTLADADADLLGPLAAQLRPASGQVRYAEFGVLVRPSDQLRPTEWLWRVGAARFLNSMQRSTPHQLGRAAIDGLARKLGEPLFETTLRLVLVAETRAAGSQMLRELASSLGQYAAGGRMNQRLALRAIHMRDAPVGSAAVRQARRALLSAPRLATPWPRVLLPCVLWPQPILLGTGELAGLWHLPSASLAGLIRRLPCRHLPAPSHAFIDGRRSGACSDSPRLTLGHAVRSNGSLAPVGPSLRDLRQILHVTAGMGGGKSRLLANLAQQLVPSGMFLIDGKGDDAGNLVQSVARLVPAADEGRLAILDITDRDWPVGLNPLSAFDSEQPGALDQLVAVLEAIFARLDPETWRQAPGMQQFLGNAARLVVETEQHPTLMHIQRALIDEHYRELLLTRRPSADVALFWTAVFPRMPESQRSSVMALLRRFEKLLASDLMRSFIAQPHSTIALERIFDERLLVLCPIPHVTYGALASTAAMLMLMLFVRAAFQRPGTSQTRADYPLIVDEVQVLVEQGAAQDLALALTQLRSLGIPAVYAHQTLAQLGDLRDILLVNAENRLIIRTQEPDASVYARQYAAAGITAADISGQEPQTHQYARFVVDGAIVPPCSIMPLPWPVTEDAQTISDPVFDWRSIVPPGSAEQMAYDRVVARLAHTPYCSALARELAHGSDADWDLLTLRWHAIAAAQRSAILHKPALIGERSERQRWLSRLAFARPRLLVEVEQLRLRGRLGTPAMTETPHKRRRAT
jgi:hypothetical protein